MNQTESEKLRILIANHGAERVAAVTEAVVGLGYMVTPWARLEDVGQATIRERPDLAIVILEESSARALGLIGSIVREATCPVIAILATENREFVNEAAKRGIFAYITDGDDPVELQSSIDIALRRFTEYHSLEGAFGRRAVTERAKGILMERHAIDEREAFDLLRSQARRRGRKVADIAEDVVASLPLLPARGRRSEQQERAEP